MGTPVRLAVEAGSGQIGVHRLVNVVNDAAEPIALYRVGIECEHDQRQFSVVRKQLAADNLV